MATLPPYFGDGTSTGKEEDIELLVMWTVWTKIGHGKFNSFSDFECSFGGHVKTIFWEGDFVLELVLKDQDPKAKSGPCIVTIIGSKDPNAHYHVEGSNLIINSHHDSENIETTISPTNRIMTKITGKHLPTAGTQTVRLNPT